MNKIKIILIVIATILLFGCEKKEVVVEEQEFCYECTQRKIYHHFNTLGQECDGHGCVNICGNPTGFGGTRVVPHTDTIITQFCGTYKEMKAYQDTMSNDYKKGTFPYYITDTLTYLPDITPLEIICYCKKK